MRRKELVKAFSPTLLFYIQEHATELVQSSFGCQFISEVLLSAQGEKREALVAVANLTQGSSEVQASLQTPAASRMLKSLALGGRFNQKTKSVDLVDPPLKFNDILYILIKHNIVQWMTGPNAFVIIGLLESADFSYSAELKALARENRKHLQDAVSGRREMDTGPGRHDEKALEAGRKGTRLLLKMIDD